MKELLGKYTNGNYKIAILEDGTKIRRVEEDDFIPEFAENMDIKITDCCSAGCPWCHEGSTPEGKHGDIMNEKFIDTLHPWQEVALGGGNVLEHPDLLPFLRKLKKMNVIANITVNQKHFMNNVGSLLRLCEERLIYGLGVSLSTANPQFLCEIKKFPNAVIHVINGIVDKEDMWDMMDLGLKILILGFKDLRRGADYLEQGKGLVEINQKWLKENIQNLLSRFDVVSFDNLALEQLSVKEWVPPKVWERFYMGDDATFTYYIDMVERKFAGSSTAPMDKRYELMDSVDDMFRIITRGE